MLITCGSKGLKHRRRLSHGLLLLLLLTTVLDNVLVSWLILLITERFDILSRFRSYRDFKL